MEWASQVTPVEKKLPANAGDTRDTGSSPGLGGPHEIGKGSPLQYSCLENSKGRGAWRATVYRAEKGVGHDWAHDMTQQWNKMQNRAHQWCGQHVKHSGPRRCHGSHSGQRCSAFPSLREVLQDLLAYKWPWNSFHPSWQPSETLGLICNKYSKILSPGSRLSFLEVILNPICVISLDLLKLFAFALQFTQRILSCEGKKKKWNGFILPTQHLSSSLQFILFYLALTTWLIFGKFFAEFPCFSEFILVLILNRTL